VEWYSLLVYNVYFDDVYVDNGIIYNDNNDRDDIVNGILVDNLKVKYK